MKLSSRPCTAIALVAIVGTGAAVSPLACGDLGQPALEGDEGALSFDAGPPPDIVQGDGGEGGIEAATIALEGRVLDPEGKPVGMALVAIEVGGLNQVNPFALDPDGGVGKTIKIDPYYRLGAITDEAGRFSLDVPNETLGVHVYKGGFYCGVPDAGAIAAETGSVTVRLVAFEGGTSEQPTVTGFTIDTGSSLEPQVAAPGVSVTLAAVVQAADAMADPLSEQVLAIEPKTSFGGAFAPPVPGTPGKSYPNGIYGRLVTAPLDPGEYTYYMIAATQACVVSEPVSRKLLVTPSGEGGFDADAEVPEIDAALDGGGDAE
jgi:hypothetical protein